MLVLLAQSVYVQGAAPPAKIADFETSLSCEKIADKNVTQTQLLSGAGNGSAKAAQFTAALAGESAGWAGVRVPFAAGTLQSAHDTIELDARADHRTRGLFVTLTESDGARWNTNIRLKPEWQHYQIPLYRFKWFEGPESRKRTSIRLEQTKSLELWMGNTFQGQNGFEVDNITASDRASSFSLALKMPQTVRQQKATTLTLVANDPGGAQSDFSGTVWLQVSNRIDALLPRSIEMTHGRGDFELFARRPAPLELHAYEPVTSQDLVTIIPVEPAELEVNFETSPFEGEQVMNANEILEPHLTLVGAAVPLTLHIEVTDHLRHKLFSSYMTVADVKAGHGKLMVVEPGMAEVHVRALAEPLTQLPHVPDNMPVQTFDLATTPARSRLPRGVTTTTVLAAQVTLEELPTTATVLGEDRYPLLVLSNTPREIYFNTWPFGLNGGGLFHLNIDDHSTSGEQRLKWERKLGSGWGRNDLWWHEIQPEHEAWSAQKVASVVSRYRNNRLRLLGVLDYEAAWSPGKSPDDENARADWMKFVSELVHRFPKQIYALEVWNEPNHGFWKPQPDTNAYRELVKATHNAVCTSGTQEIPCPTIVAGATAGYDPVFLGKLTEDDYPRYYDALSFHPYPESLDGSPEENAFPEVLDEAKNLLRQKQLNKELWLTEVGWPVCPGGVSELDQANYLVRALTISLHKGIDKFFWFNLLDWTPWFDSDDFGAYTGLLDSNCHPKPAAAAYNIATYMLPTSQPKEHRREGKADIYKFLVYQQSVKYGGWLHVAWTTDKADEQDIELPMVTNGAVWAVDYLGAERRGQLIRTEVSDKPTTGPGGKLPSIDDRPTTRTYRFHINHEPLYIWDAVMPRRKTER